MSNDNKHDLSNRDIRLQKINKSDRWTVGHKLISYPFHNILYYSSVQNKIKKRMSNMKETNGFNLSAWLAKIISHFKERPVYIILRVDESNIVSLLGISSDLGAHSVLLNYRDRDVPDYVR